MLAQRQRAPLVGTWLLRSERVGAAAWVRRLLDELLEATRRASQRAIKLSEQEVKKWRSDDEQTFAKSRANVCLHGRKSPQRESSIQVAGFGPR